MAGIKVTVNDKVCGIKVTVNVSSLKDTEHVRYGQINAWTQDWY